MPPKFSESQLEDIRNAIETLEDGIWNVEDLEDVTIAIDTVASLLSPDGAELTDDCSSASDVFSSLEKDGLDSRAKSAAETLAEIASLSLYDDDEKSESKLEEAEETREELVSYLHEFLKQIMPGAQDDAQ